MTALSSAPVEAGARISTTPDPSRLRLRRSRVPCAPPCPRGPRSRMSTTGVFSLAGADWDEDIRELVAAVGAIVPRADVAVVNDAIGALRAGTDDGVGVSVVVGTGGCVGSMGRDGRVWHSSWWALDTGAWAIGGDALRAVYNAELAVGPETALTAAALELFEAASVEEVLYEFTRRGGRHSWDAAHFAPSVLHAAHDGDAVAAAIVRDHGVRLGEMARVAVRKVGPRGTVPPRTPRRRPPWRGLRAHRRRGQVACAGSGAGTTDARAGRRRAPRGTRSRRRGVRSRACRRDDARRAPLRNRARPARCVSERRWARHRSFSRRGADSPGWIAQTAPDSGGGVRPRATPALTSSPSVTAPPIPVGVLTASDA